MARDNERNRNITVPFARRGKTLASLEADAERHNMVNFIGVLAGLRLGEYYEAVEEGRILPKGMSYNGNIAQMQPQSPIPSLANGNGQYVAPAPNLSFTDLERLQDRPDIIAESAEGDDTDFSFFDE